VKLTFGGVAILATCAFLRSVSDVRSVKVVLVQEGAEVMGTPAFKNYTIHDSSYLPRKAKKAPRHVYWCGYSNMFGHLGFNVGENLFPEVTVSMLQANSTASEDDLLLYPCGGPCPTGFATFPGKILTFNGESSSSKCRLPGLRTNNVPTMCLV
jgi:hypothetical protein